MRVVAVALPRHDPVENVFRHHNEVAPALRQAAGLSFSTSQGYTFSDTALKISLATTVSEHVDTLWHQW